MPRYATYNDWLNDLISEQLGRIWLSKFQYDLKNGNLLPMLEVRFSNAIENNLRRFNSLPSAMSVIDFVIMEDSISFDLQGQRLPSAQEPYSCILRVEAFALYYIRRRILLTILDEGDDEMDFVWENLGGLITPHYPTILRGLA